MAASMAAYPLTTFTFMEMMLNILNWWNQDFSDIGRFVDDKQSVILEA